MKISAFHKQQGDQVKWWNAFESFDKIYGSKIFTKSKFPYLPQMTIMGGSGYNLTKTLPDEMEYIYPDYELYGIDYAMGYMTRGCNNQCPFCIVPKKEGNLRYHQTFRGFWKGQDKLMLLDNNLFDCPFVYQDLELIIQLGIKLNLTQGFNIRTLTQEKVNYLKQLKLWKPSSQWHFAWDNPADELLIRKGLELLNQNGIKNYKLMCFVLCGFNTTFDQDLYRIQKLDELGIDPFVMEYHKHNPKLNFFAKWCNRQQLHHSCTFEAYLKTRENIQ